jgi:phytoene dehydrogenase-like protein
MERNNHITDAVVVGGGLAGLAAATYLARARLSVILLEQSRQVGGRAVTQTVHGGFRFNMGAHALYLKGYAIRVLQELGIKFSGRPPSARGRYAIRGRKIYTFPGEFASILGTRLLGFRQKIEAARILATLARIDTRPLQGLSLRQWLTTNIRSEASAQLIMAVCRLSTYTNDCERGSAGATLDQLKLAVSGGVIYLDEGWQTLVDRLKAAALAAGVRITEGARVEAVESNETGNAVHLVHGESLSAAKVLLATGPYMASKLVNGGRVECLRSWASYTVPVRAASLDVALKRLPDPGHLFALGIDCPLYFSVHSAAAKLAPEGGAVIHLLKYLSGDEHDHDSDRRQLEDLLDLMQPGWRAETAGERFLPRITVSHALVRAGDGGIAGRPGPAVPGLPNLSVIGDWVGSEGMLADASLASARRAAVLIEGKSHD